MKQNHDFYTIYSHRFVSLGRKMFYIFKKKRMQENSEKVNFQNIHDSGHWP
jgi:lipopolysaccharide/colanic/teichoic acid biosynthesis glycosyltransferase